ncbi:MAG: hypothetical protein AMXMBFR7_38050 [Planctomycetota bacterium]
MANGASEEGGLEAALARYRVTFGYIMEGCQLIGFDWRYLYLNETAAKHNRRPNSELLGLRMQDAWPGIDGLPVFAMLRRCMDERIALHMEVEFQFPDGFRGWFDVRGQAVPEGIFVFSIDITERKKAELRNRYLNRVYAVLSEINHTIVREKDSDRMLGAACRIAVESGGFRMAWIGLFDTRTGKLGVRAHAGADSVTLGLLKSLIQSEPPAGCAFTQRALKQGTHGICNDIACDPLSEKWREAALERQYLAMAAFPLKSEGRIVGTFNLYVDERGFFDETEQRLLDELAMDIGFALEVSAREAQRARMEIELRDSQERFRQLAENIDQVFWIRLPGEERLVYASPAFEAIWGRSCEDLYASPELWLDAVHREDRERVRIALLQQTAESYDETYRIAGRGGQERWIRDRSFPLRNERGEVFRIVGIAADVTSSRQMEQQLRQAQKLEGIGQLAGGIAHDFNNLLTVINGRSMLVLNKLPAADPIRDEVAQILKTGQRAAALTKQLLAFSRKQMLEPRIVNVNVLIAEMESMLKRLLREDIEYQSRLSGNVGTVKIDPGQLEQVLLNLVVNARDAMPEGGKLTVETARVELDEKYIRQHLDAAPGTYTQICVSDTGEGMSEETKRRIFEPFFTTKEQGKGTGLGLATVFGIVKQSGGMLEVYSELGSGSVFKIYLPVVRGTEVRPTRSDGMSAPHGHETVLVVEDEVELGHLLRDILTSFRYQVLLATRPSEALALVRDPARKVDLAITDVVMPEMNGPALVQEIRRLRPGLKAILMSGYTDLALTRSGTLDGTVHFIQKPFMPDLIARKVREVLDQTEDPAPVV